MVAATSFIAGLVFGVGLVLSGMTDPRKVIGFLDLAGAWDPSLALVMGGAILVGLPAFSVARRQEHSVLGAPMPAPPTRRIDRPLIAGATLFGVGWGLSGLCPGPAIVAAGAGATGGLLFTAAMLAGMTFHSLLGGPSTASTPQQDGETP